MHHRLLECRLASLALVLHIEVVDRTAALFDC